MGISELKHPDVVADKIISDFKDILIIGFEDCSFELVKRSAYIHACVMQNLDSFSLLNGRKKRILWEIVKDRIKNYKP